MTKNTGSASTLEQKPQQFKVTSNASLAASVKREKIDEEIEKKLDALNAKVKAHCPTSPTVSGTETDGSNSNSNSNDSSQDDKKQITPVKSSNEILAELFSVFNAAPPVELLDDTNLLKKHKKSKKEKKKRSRGKLSKSDGECSDSDETSAESKFKHKHKRRKHKHKHKDGKEKHKDKDREKSRERSNLNLVKLEERIETRKRHAPVDGDSTPVPAKKEIIDYDHYSERDRDRVRDRERERERDRERDREREREKERERERDRERDRERERERDREREKDREWDRIDNGFYNGYQDKQEDKHSHNNTKSGKSISERRLSDEVSLSDEETYLREKANGQRSFYADDKPDSTNDTQAANTRRRRRRWRSRIRSRSRSRDSGIDKKRLLEIARRNAINMFKRGDLPGVAEMAPEVKDRVLVKMRYSGRTVQDLTEFCKKISNGEKLSDLSSDEDSDVDKNGNAKAFHHPFQLKEREPIVMHIRNSTPLVPSSTLREEQTKAITMQFPVSSGQVHRMSEVWVPVDPKESLAPLPTLPPARQATNIFKDVQRNVFAKTIPQQEQQEPAFKPLPNLVESGTSECSSLRGSAMSTTVANPAAPVSTTASAIVPSQPPPMLRTNFVPEVPIPSTAPAASGASIFPQPSANSTDVSSIITQRLNAIRRLQDNPADSEAMKMMYNVHNDMTSWASSKFLPGQFTGSTGAQVMKVHELNSGRQLWTRRDQLTCTKPVTGGMGMTLLQKMGWKPGEGLGRSKSGSLQPLQLMVKLDKRGLVSREDIKQQPTRTKGSNAPKNTSAVNIAQAALTARLKHPVCVLNELTSKNKWTPPQYILKEASGPSHSRLFLFSVEVNGQTYTPSEPCNNKKEAKLNAAKLCLRSLGILPPS